MITTTAGPSGRYDVLNGRRWDLYQIQLACAGLAYGEPVGGPGDSYSEPSCVLPGTLVSNRVLGHLMYDGPV